MKKLLNKQTVTPNVETSSPAKTTRLLLRMLRAAQPISRIELARRLGVNRSTVTDILKPLISADLVREKALMNPDGRAKAQGRPPIGLFFNSDNDYFVGINIGVRRSQIGLTTLSGEMLAEEDFETPSEASAALRLITEKTIALCSQISGRTLRIIGVSVPGPTDAERSRLLYAPHLGWRDVEIADSMRRAFGSAGFAENYSVVVENDATASATFEARLHLKKTDGGLLENFVLLRSGTGIGIGLVIDGEVYRGTAGTEGLAGEFGHMTIVAGGKPCVCGNRGCWERYASASAASSLYTGDRVQLGNAKAPRFIEIVELAEAGEIRARRTLEQIGEYLGIGISNVLTGIGVPHIIISGRLVYAWRFIEEPLRRAVEKSMAGKLFDWTIECGEPKAAAIGGALEVAVEEFLEHGLISRSNG